MRRRLNPYSEAIYPALVAAADGPLRAWLQARATAVRRVIASLDDRPASATGPKLAEVVTRATGAATFDAHDPYFQRDEDSARKALTFLPPGFRVDRRESKYGQIYIFLDSENRLLTRSDYARFGAPEKEAAYFAAKRAEKVSARERIDSIQNLVSRGVKRETGALFAGSGMVRYRNGLAFVWVTPRGWTVDPNPYHHQGGAEALSGTFTDADAPEAIAAAIFAALRQLFPRPFGVG